MLKVLAKTSLTAALVVALVLPQTPGEVQRAHSSQEQVAEDSLLSKLQPAEYFEESDPGLLEELSPAIPPEPGPRPDCDQVKCIALTFDDGPGDATLEVLSALNRFGAKATFFVLGSAVRANPEVASLMTNLGHEIGAHSFRHDRLTELSSASLVKDFSRTNQAIEEVTAVRPKLFRPPYGLHSSRVRELSQLPVIMWSVDPHDWKNRNAKITAARVINRAHPGAIVVLHDPLPSTARALPRILSELESRGYHFVTVTELLGELSPGVVYESSQD